MGLPHLVDSIRADFEANLVPCPVLYGPDHIAEHASPMRIVVVPTSDNFGPPDYVQQVSFPDGDMADGQNPRTIATRIEGGRANIWAAGTKQVDPTTQQRADYDALHLLINQFILSLHRSNPGNYTLKGGSTVETTRVDRLGYVYELDFTVEVPIIDISWPQNINTPDLTTYTEETGVEQDSTIQMLNPDGSVMASVNIT